MFQLSSVWYVGSQSNVHVDQKLSLCLLNFAIEFRESLIFLTFLLEITKSCCFSLKFGKYFYIQWFKIIWSEWTCSVVVRIINNLN